MTPILISEPVGPALVGAALLGDVEELEFVLLPLLLLPHAASVVVTAANAATPTSQRLVVVLTGIGPLSRGFPSANQRRVPQSEAGVTVGGCDAGYKTIRKILHRIVTPAR
jgi:hypothetical protein